MGPGEAVRAGGGTNKRMGLFDVAMIKDNHKLAAGSITGAYERVRAAFPGIPVQVEVTTVEEAVERLDHLQKNGPSNYAFDWAFASAQLWKTARCAPGEHAA